MNLILDIGNTRTKLALFERGSIEKIYHFGSGNPRQLEQFLKEVKGVDKGIVSNVNQPMEFKDLSFPILELSRELNFPFGLQYSTPQTLGLDRIALVSAAQHLYKGEDCLIIDAGTCVTYDFLSKEGIYRGGGISPGIRLRLRSLKDYTARLPLIEIEEDQLIGDSTKASILSGTVGGFKREVEATILEYQNRYPSLVTIITGGDAKLFDNLLKNSIFASPDFLLIGLNHILEHNAERL